MVINLDCADRHFTLTSWKCLFLFLLNRSPAPGYYNDDDVPDFMVSWQYGPGFPIYYHTAVSVFINYDLLVPKEIWPPASDNDDFKLEKPFALLGLYIIFQRFKG